MTEITIFVCLSFIDAEMKKYIPREIYKNRIDRYIGKEIIKVLIGQRRVGKSYLLFQAMDSIKKQNFYFSTSLRIRQLALLPHNRYANL